MTESTAPIYIDTAVHPMLYTPCTLEILGFFKIGTKTVTGQLIAGGVALPHNWSGLGFGYAKMPSPWNSTDASDDGDSDDDGSGSGVTAGAVQSVSFGWRNGAS